eukprot:TRINITY_DN12028_c0_g1_i1.p1 TRINITY_DN12028_c0_g1~~TRINITY_DN12028_c0_g1_i1.p1  ORF type:complete len:247 (-),score=55.01 TRINITY_DN12028_c0_g1_i1:110-790(-)
MCIRDRYQRRVHGILNDTQSFVATLIAVKCVQPCLGHSDKEEVQLLLQLIDDRLKHPTQGLSALFSWLRNDWVSSKETDYQIIGWGFSQIVRHLRNEDTSALARAATIEYLKLLAVYFVNVKATGIDAEAVCQTIRILILFRRAAILADAKPLCDQILKIVCTQVDAATLRICIQSLEPAIVEELKEFITTHVVAPQSAQGEAGGYAAGPGGESRGGGKLRIRKAN